MKNQKKPPKKRKPQMDQKRKKLNDRLTLFVL